MKNLAALALSFFVLVLFSAFLGSCNDADRSDDSTSKLNADSSDAWKVGIALWTFHDVDFPASLDLARSAGLRLIEPNTFHKSGHSLLDTLVGNLSGSGVASLKSMIAEKGLMCESVYVAGDSTFASWVKQFRVAKEMGAKFVTTEPPTGMLDAIDSLAGANGLKVAIHNHWRGTSEFWHPDSTLKALEGHPNFGVCADLGHFPKSGINPVDAIRKFRGKLFAIHLKDISAFDNPLLKDVPAGKGVVDFRMIFSELQLQGFNGNIYIERDSVETGGNLKSVRETISWYTEQIR